MMEMQLSKSKENMTSKIPEIEKALEIIQVLEKERGFYLIISKQKKSP
jgi:hypothetical protein